MEYIYTVPHKSIGLYDLASSEVGSPDELAADVIILECMFLLYLVTSTQIVCCIQYTNIISISESGMYICFQLHR